MRPDRRFLFVSATVGCLFAIGLLPDLAQGGGAQRDSLAPGSDGRREGLHRVTPLRGIDGRSSADRRPRVPFGMAPSFDGRENNRSDPGMGASGTPLLRLMPADYADGLSAMAGGERPDPRAISNAVHAQPESRPNPLGVSDFFWQWGQFLDHDIDLTQGMDPPEPADIPVPAGDPWFDPDGTGDRVIACDRSIHDPESGVDTPRQQLNQISAWIDASNVYGSDAGRARALRTNDGTGRLLTSEGDLLPYNSEGLPNAGGQGADLFLAGDVRANEQAGLTALHTLFVREHNRLAGLIAAAEPRLSGDEIYQRARRIVIAQIQVITYREFLPVLLGPEPLEPYAGYDPKLDARISNEFSTAAYRFGHSALSETLLRLDAHGAEIEAGHLALRDAFFAPSRIADEGGIAPLLRGLASQVCQSVDVYVIDEVRNFLFGPPGAGGFDLAALNIQRGRDHGLPSYAEARAALGLGRPERFSDVSSDPEVQSRLAETYGDVALIDLWVGGLAEDPLPGAMVGALVDAISRDQFQALRDGDRFWYTRTLDRRKRAEVEGTRLSDIIRRNTEIGREIPDDVFHVSFFPACRGRHGRHKCGPRRIDAGFRSGR